MTPRSQWSVWVFLMAGAAFAQAPKPELPQPAVPKIAFTRPLTIVFSGDNGGEVAPCG